MATRSNTPPKPYLGFGTRIRKSPFFESTLKLIPPFGNYVNYAFMIVIFLFLVIWTYKMFVHKQKGQEHASE